MNDNLKTSILISLIILALVGTFVFLYTLIEDFPSYSCPEDYKMTEDKIIDGISFGKCEYTKQEYKIINNEFVEINNTKKPIIMQADEIPEHGLVFKTFYYIGLISIILIVFAIFLD